MEDNWYKTSETKTAEWYSAAQAEQNARQQPQQPIKKRRSFKWPLILLTLCILLGGTLYAMSQKGRTPESEEPAKDSGFSYSWGFGNLPGSEDGQDAKDESTLPDDFAEFFRNYYSSFETPDACSIPRVEARKDLHIELQTEHGEELSLQEIYQQCNPFIVAVSAYEKPNSTSYSYGTGVLFSSDGYIITNSHIVEGSSRALVSLWDDSEYEARLVGNDPRSDIAVLKIEGRNLPCCTFADSDKLQVGDEVLAIGNPLDSTFRSTMTNGIITGIDRDMNYNGATMTLIQTNAALNEGNSGGALINRYGQVIGITNMKMSNKYGKVTIEGVGFAIPSATVRNVADSILRDGEVRGRPALGITVGAVSDAIAAQYSLPTGLYISEVKPGSDCAAKGLQVGDIVTHVNGKAAAVTTDVTGVIAQMQVGDTLTLTVFRPDPKGESGESFDVKVKLVDVNDVY